MASRFGSLIILFLVFCNNPKIITASLDIKSGDCVPEKDFMRIVEWFFRQSEVLVVIDLDQNDILGGFQKHFLEKVFSDLENPKPVVYKRLRSANDTEDVSWKFARKSGVMLIGDSFETIKKLFASLDRDVNINRKGDFMFTIVSPGLNPVRIGSAPSSPTVDAMDVQVMGEFFRGLWKDFNILNSVVVILRCAKDEVEAEAEISDLDVGYYNPFEYVGGFEGQDKLNWGQFHWTTQSGLREEDRDFMTKRYVPDFRGYPIKVNQFRRYPTAIDPKYIPIAVQQSHIYKQCLPTDWFGHDGLILRNLELSLNFSKQNVPVPLEYGWMADNGTFVGSIGDILRKDIDVSFNGRFIKYYDTFDVDFMTPVLFENFCIVAPKALRIPEYLRIFQCFHPTVWAAIVIINLALGCLWFCTKRVLFGIAIRHHFENEGQCTFSPDLDTIPATEIRMMDNEITMRFSFPETVIEMWNIMFAAPSFHLPLRNVERIMMTSCLLANLIITGTFQGTLTTSFSTVTYYKDINTLQELDATGLPINVGSRSILDIFGEDGSPLIRSLASKMVLKNSANVTSMYSTAHQRKSFAVERKADLNVIIATNFVAPGGRPMVHVVQECPRDYYVAYLTRAGWPLLPTFNWLIQKFFEAGLIQKWYEVTESAIIDHFRMATPSEDESMKPLSLIDIQTSFYILAIGLSMCAVVFVAELFCSKRPRTALSVVQEDYYLVQEKASGINK